MKHARRALLASAVAALLAGQGVADEAPRVAEIPYLGYRPGAGRATGPPLRRSVDLLNVLWRGEGTTTGSPAPARVQHGSVSIRPMPWPAPELAVLVQRRQGEFADETLLALRLDRGARWCTPPFELPHGSRLRLEALALEPGAPGRLRVEWRSSARRGLDALEGAGRPDERALRPLDLPLPEGRGELCLEAVDGRIAVGEPRIVAPEPPGTDPRPRWIVLAIHDALRADTLTRADSKDLAPALAALAERGLRFAQAVSPGAHTQAAVAPLLSGRDLARIDPVRAHRYSPAGTPLALVYSRPNIPVSQMAQAAGYHPVFLGNNSFLLDTPAFARMTNRGSPQTGTHDTIAALPDLFDRYADERIFLVFYVSTPHGFSWAPRRLAERLGCASRSAAEAERCFYDARVAHADEATHALQDGLAASGLAASTLQVLTADHGEIFGDGRKLEALLFDKWMSLDYGHGGATHWNEIHVPLVVAGPGVAPGVSSDRVSTLDVVPTLVALGRFPSPLKLDGRPLPRLSLARGEAGPLVTQGYCTHSVLEGETQLVLWQADCARRRELGSGRAVSQRAELWRGGTLAATDSNDPKRLGPLVQRHLEWLAARLPGEAWLLDAPGVDGVRVRVTASDGRITDFGPASGPAYLGSLSATLAPDARQLELELGGRSGLVAVSTWPPEAKVRFEVADAGPAPATLVGSLQLPLPLLGREVDPSEARELWRASSALPTPGAAGPRLRVWRQPYGKDKPQSQRGALTELDRVLREWGYIR